MKNNLLGAAILASVAIAAGAPMRAEAVQAPQNFTVTNQTNHKIVELYVTPSHSAEWGPDVMQSESLPPNTETDIVFSPLNNVCIYDMKATYSSGEQAEWQNINLCQISGLTLLHDERTGKNWVAPR